MSVLLTEQVLCIKHTDVIVPNHTRASQQPFDQ